MAGDGDVARARPAAACPGSGPVPCAGRRRRRPRRRSCRRRSAGSRGGPRPSPSARRRAGPWAAAPWWAATVVAGAVVVGAGASWASWSAARRGGRPAPRRTRCSRSSWARAVLDAGAPQLVGDEEQHEDAGGRSRTRPSRPTHQRQPRHPRRTVPAGGSVHVGRARPPARPCGARPVAVPAWSRVVQPGRYCSRPTHGAGGPPSRSRGAPRALPGAGRRDLDVAARRDRPRPGAERRRQDHAAAGLRRPGGRSPPARPSCSATTCGPTAGRCGARSGCSGTTTTSTTTSPSPRTCGSGAAPPGPPTPRSPPPWPASASQGRLAGDPVGRLSAGQRRRTALAALVARRPELWLLDEPHAGLDADGRDLLDDLVRRGGRRRRHRGARLPRARPGRAPGPPHGRDARPVGRVRRRRPRRTPTPVGAVLRAAALVAGKDLRIEARSRVATNQVLPFALVVLLLFAFALDPDRGTLQAATPGLFWVAVLLTAGHRRAAVLRPSRRPTAAATACACPASTRPASSSARPAPWPPQLAACSRSLLGVGVRAALRRRPAGRAASPCWSVTVARDDGRPGRHGYPLRRPRRRRWSPGDAAPAPPAPGGGAGADRCHEGHRSSARHRRREPRRRAGPGSASSGCSPSPTARPACWPSGRSWRTHESTAITTHRHEGRPAARRRRRRSIGAGAGCCCSAWCCRPTTSVQGDAVRMIYVHVPVGLAGLPGLLRHRRWARCCYLVPRTRSLAWDRVADASAEIGVLFTGLTLVTGMIWGHLTWGVFWTLGRPPHLDRPAVRALPRLPGPAAAAGDARACGPSGPPSLGIVAFIDVPIVHMSVEWWRTLHQKPTVLRPTSTRRSTALMLFSAVRRRRRPSPSSTCG